MASPSDTAQRVKLFIAKRLSVDLDAEIKDTLARGGITIPKPEYDIDYQSAQQGLDAMKFSGCQNVEDALYLLSAAATYYLAEKCTPATALNFTQHDGDIFQENRVVNDMCAQPGYIPDLSKFSTDPDETQMNAYLVASKFLVLNNVRLVMADNPQPEHVSFVAAMPHFLEWLDNDILAKTEAEKADAPDLGFCKAVRKCVRVLKPAYESLARDLGLTQRGLS